MPVVVGRMCFARRAEVVLDRRGVSDHGWGWFDWWRVRLKGIRGVVVRPVPVKWRKGLAGDVMWATVAVEGERDTRRVRGVYPYAVAVEAEAFASVVERELGMGERVG